jgi:translation initiation factor 5B
MARQPIVSVLGHVDHGKTTLLDSVRGTKVAARESGGITQHIGATEVPLQVIMDVCKDIAGKKHFKVPGLLFIDTPGHHSFTTLRARGGALADLAVLVIDINEGFRPQTIESLSILKRYKTPFVVAANKIDMIPGWRKHPKAAFGASLAEQTEGTRDELDRRLYELVGKLFEQGFTAERYDKVEDFTTTLAVVPVSAKFGEGIPDLLLMLVGLAQRFLESQLETGEGPGEGTILEVKEEKGLGPTLNAIIFDGVISKGDTVVLGGMPKPIVTKVKALLKPKPLDEIRDPQDRFDSVKKVIAAAGIKISASGLDGAMAGAPIRVATRDTLDAIVAKVEAESSIQVVTQEEGILVKADAIGSLEALAFECKASNIPIRFARVGPVSRRDVVDAATVQNPLHKVMFTFNVPVLPDAKEELLKNPDVKILENDVIYRLIEDYQKWLEERLRELAEEKRQQLVFPGKILVLGDYVFNISKPAIFGVRILAGKLRSGDSLLKDDGRAVGRVKSIQDKKASIKEAKMGAEVAVAMDGVTFGRQVKGDDVLYVEMPEADARALSRLELTMDEKEALDKVCEIKRREDPFWGM